MRLTREISARENQAAAEEAREFAERIARIEDNQALGEEAAVQVLAEEADWRKNIARREQALLAREDELQTQAREFFDLIRLYETTASQAEPDNTNDKESHS